MTNKLNEILQAIGQLRNSLFDSQKAADNKSEKRFKYRAKTHSNGLITVEGTIYPVDVLDISKTGALIRCHQISLVLGQNYQFKFSIADKGEFELLIKAMRVDPENQSHYGVLFQNATLATLREISEYVTDMAKDELYQGFDPNA